MKSSLERNENCYGLTFEADGGFEVPTLYGPNRVVRVSSGFVLVMILILSG
jgi:hypothetical protein